MVSPYIVNFVSFADKLIIELDGPQHLEPNAIDHDKRRTDWLITRGFHIIRFRNQELDENIHVVVDAIERTLENAEAPRPIPPSPTLPAEGREPKAV